MLESAPASSPGQAARPNRRLRAARKTKTRAEEPPGEEKEPWYDVDRYQHCWAYTSYSTYSAAYCVSSEHLYQEPLIEFPAPCPHVFDHVRWWIVLSSVLLVRWVRTKRPWQVPRPYPSKFLQPHSPLATALVLLLLVGCGAAQKSPAFHGPTPPKGKFKTTHHTNIDSAVSDDRENNKWSVFIRIGSWYDHSDHSDVCSMVTE